MEADGNIGAHSIHAESEARYLLGGLGRSRALRPPAISRGRGLAPSDRAAKQSDDRTPVILAARFDTSASNPIAGERGQLQRTP
ncbi:hypothetical protein HPB47_006885 [Ixodes persulcatus]|uniref:Uncharacterized protein n=1 Tax=Ixodes persulcatus TaxID=34615 RepID=A0AC60P9Z5_IXOPE|nr:hypothetical protein HPB47_006885 [Ixodes persulcatus]